MTSAGWPRVQELFDAAQALPDDQRSEFLAAQCPDDPTVRAEVESLLAALHDAGTFLEQPAIRLLPSDGAMGEPGQPAGRIGPWQLVREVGRGGMGTVFLATRTERDFEMRVALKVINRGMDTDLIVRRFRTERRILAGLEHPGIARLIDGGSTDDGLPFFVLEFVEGEPIDAWCDARGLSVHARLQLFRKVCAAVGFAHQALVVHRDLKPGNIFVTRDGEPKLLDFGLAAFLGPDQREPCDQTVSAVRLLTPGYASPEQVRGERITTATDVYSLGILLYELLSGRRPYDVSGASPEEIGHIVCSQEPARPSVAALGSEAASPSADELARRRGTVHHTLVRQLRGDLDTIVLKAIQKDPARRYASVERLSEDIRRHLDGRPVTARPDSFWYRNGKFLRRNRVSVTAAGLLGAAIMAGAAATAWQARIANGERARAERRFNDVHTLAHALMFDIHDEMEKVPGSTKARELLVKKALEYLDGLAREAGGDLSLQRELADAYQRVGDIQGGIGVANVGDVAGARSSYDRAVRIRDSILATGTATTADRLALALALRSRGDTAEEPAEWLHYARRSVAVVDEVVRAQPRNLAGRLQAQTARMAQADALATLGRLEDALVVHRERLSLCEETAREFPASFEARRGVAVAHYKIGQTLMNLKRFDEALTSLARGRSEFTKLIEANPEKPILRYHATMPMADAGQVLMELKRPAEALEPLGEAVRIRKALLAEDPANAEIALFLNETRGHLGQALSDCGRRNEGVSLVRTAVAFFEKRAAAEPTDPRAREALQSSRKTLASLLAYDPPGVGVSQ